MSTDILVFTAFGVSIVALLVNIYVMVTERKLRKAHSDLIRTVRRNP